MAKETSNKPCCLIRFNELVNAILLIMFLAVVIILSVKGCGTCLIGKSQDIQKVQNENIVAEADSTKNDSIIDVL